MQRRKNCRHQRSFRSSVKSQTAKNTLTPTSKWSPVKTGPQSRSKLTIPHPKPSKCPRCRPRASKEGNQPNSNARRANTEIRREGLLYAAQASGLRKLTHRRGQGFLHQRRKKVGAGTSLPTGVYSG